MGVRMSPFFALNQKELEKFHQTQIIQSILNDIQNNN